MNLEAKLAAKNLACLDIGLYQNPGRDDEFIRYGYVVSKAYLSEHPDDEHDMGLLIPDNPYMDGTDAAHPAWWRGNERGVQVACEFLNIVLDGKDNGSGTMGGKELEALRRRLLAMKGKT